MNKLSRNILKIIFISLILILSVGSIYASEDLDLDDNFNDDIDDEFELDDDIDEDFDD